MHDSLIQLGADLRNFMATSLTKASPPDAGVSEDAFGAWALRVFSLQMEFNPAYRSDVIARGIRPDSVRDWRDIPAMPAAAFKELELTAIPPAERTRVFHSSGTTGQTPSRHVHCPDSLALYEASLWPWFSRHVLPDLTSSGDSGLPWIGALTPSPDQAPHSSLAYMLEVVLRRAAGTAAGSAGGAFLGSVDREGAWHVDTGGLRIALDRAMEERRPVLLLGTAFNFVHVLDDFAASGRRCVLPAGSRIMETGGYKGRSRELSRSELHRALGECLGIPPEGIVSEYGMSELGSQAYDTVVGRGGVRWLRFPPWARPRVISAENGREVPDGGTGLLRIADLSNAWSVVMVQTADLAVRRGEGFELVGRAPLAEARGCSLQSFRGD